MSLIGLKRAFRANGTVISCDARWDLLAAHLFFYFFLKFFRFAVDKRFGIFYSILVFGIGFFIVFYGCVCILDEVPAGEALVRRAQVRELQNAIEF